MDKIEKSITNEGKPLKRVVTKETALSLFESALSYMLEAGWEIIAEQDRREDGMMVSTFHYVGMGYEIEDEEISLFEDVPIAPNVPTDEPVLVSG